LWDRIYVSKPLRLYIYHRLTNILYIFPKPLKYLIAPLVNAITVNKQFTIVKRLIGPIILERKKRAHEEGANWKGRPDDMLQWLIESAPQHLQHTNTLVSRLIGINMAAIHTTSSALYNSLFCLAMYPEYIPELREEIEQAMAQNKNKASMMKMVKLDSFMREAHRLNGPSITIMGRKVLKDGFTFSNGLYLPPGVHASIPETIHVDEHVYGEDALKFDGFRFSRLPDMADTGEQGQDAVKRKCFVTTGQHYLRFGHGHGACPGRFFVALEVKLILSMILMDYDVKLVDIPKSSSFVIHRIPDLKARILFRKRKMGGS